MKNWNPHKILLTMIFVSWYATIGLAFAFLFLARRSVLPFYTENILRLLTLNYYIGIGLIVVWIIPFLISYFHTNIFKSVLVVGILGVFGFLYWQTTMVPEPKRMFHNGFNPNQLESFYVGLVFDVMGYPPDEHMTSAMELMNEVNSYRKKLHVHELQFDLVSCQKTEARIKAIESLTFARQSSSVTITSDNENDMPRIAFIDEVHEQPISGEHLVNIVWNRPFARQTEIVSDPAWQGGCASVSGLTTSFIFDTYK